MAHSTPSCSQRFWPKWVMERVCNPCHRGRSDCSCSSASPRPGHRRCGLAKWKRRRRRRKNPGGPVPDVFMSGGPIDVRIRLPDAIVIRKPCSQGSLAKSSARSPEPPYPERQRQYRNRQQQCRVGEVLVVVSRPLSRRMSAATVLLPRPLRDGGSLKKLVSPTPSSEKRRVVVSQSGRWQRCVVASLRLRFMRST